jgi:hypothetical protein
MATNTQSAAQVLHAAAKPGVSVLETGTVGAVLRHVLSACTGPALSTLLYGEP